MEGFTNASINKMQKFNFYNIVPIIMIIFLGITSLKAQPGSITGKVFDKNNNEALIGANVLILNSVSGASTDIDGIYLIKNLSPGNYDLRFSFISYQSVIVKNVIVKPGEATKIDISLEAASTELEEILITAEALKSTENAVLKIQKNSANIVDGISAELINKNNSSNGTDILRRMTGVTISEEKYAFIRGIGDRYNSTLLNGAKLPSTDPEKKSFSYDLLPASLIENIITAKTFTADKPADFSGGLVQINTIEFPSKFFLDISTSADYNTNTTCKTFYTYNGGKTDFLGFDDGTRNMPDDITSIKLARGNFPDSALTAITKSFSNNWQTNTINAPFNGSMKLDIGNKINIGDNVLGYIGSLSYSNSGATKNLERNFYDFSGARYNYKGYSYNRSVVLAGLFNLSYKFDQTNKISLKNIYNQNADDITTLYSGDYRYADQYRNITSFSYVSRSLLSNQLIGQHLINLLNGVNIDWNLSYSQSVRSEPDGRRYIYARSIDEKDAPLRFQLDQSLVTRYYGDLKDHNYNGNIDLNFQIFEDPELPKIKIGYLYDKKDRNFSARTFGFKNIPGGNFVHEDSVLQGSVEDIFNSDNTTNKFIQAIEITKPSDSYTSKQTINSGYIMFNATLFQKFKLAAGARYEGAAQKLISIDLKGDSINIDDTYEDVLPSINLTYLLNDWINLRSAYSITLARPEFRELAPFSYFDFISNELIQGNPALKRTLINNYDFRIEIYPGTGELVALSFFYKKFHDPIEEVLQAAANEPIRSFENAEKAENYGIELELRKSLNFISPAFQKLFFIGNLSLIKSEVQLKDNGFQEANRALQGQAPYIFNLGLYYDNYELGLNSSLIYNKVGERIAKVGSKDLGNILEKPVDIIDFTISKNLLEYFTIRFSVKDLLNQDRIFMQQSPLGDKISELEKVGRNISLGLTYKF